MVRLFEQVTNARISLIEGEAATTFGPVDAPLQIELVIHRKRVWGDLLLGGTLAAGETYMRGDWSTDDLVGLIRVLLQTDLQELAASSPWVSFANRVFHALRRNTPGVARQNIAAHYDLGNDFFRLFLDNSMMYSAAYFDDRKTSLEKASRAKVDRLCQKLSLAPGMEVIEIGSGWGYLACHLAREYGCRVTTTTISREQFSLTTERVAREGLQDRVRVVLEDYRSLRGEFDRLISVEMIEAVGHEYLDTYFERCSRLLRPTGRMVLQAITIPDEHLVAYRRNVDFIQRYIFPGGALPSLGQVMQSVARRTDLRLVHGEDLPDHYAQTLREWRQRFWKAEKEVRGMGFDDSFLRRWDYYFAYCEAAFLERTIGLAQLVFEKPRHAHE
ncbi:cyclopropane-fatty-acyl-phospholipid synthase family protein [bacterium]|nr:cyclopropane-fatty-acyl-phospholipid synthase family protein [bacterium]